MSAGENRLTPDPSQFCSIYSQYEKASTDLEAFFLAVILLICSLDLLSEIVKINDNKFSVQVFESNDEIVRINYEFGTFEKLPISINKKFTSCLKRRPKYGRI